MTFVYFLIAASFELGLAFPAGGLQKEVNIGEFLQFSHEIVRVHRVDISPYVRVSRYPGITSPLSVYDGSLGIIVGLTGEIAGISGGAGFGAGVHESSERIFHPQMDFILRKSVMNDINLGLVVLVPFMFFKNATIFSINIGFLLGI